MNAPRFATAADISELVRVINRAYRVEDFFVSGDRTDEADIRRRLDIPCSQFLVIDSGLANTLAACVFVELRGARGFFALLAVDPVHQGQGLARRLVEAVEAHCRAAGCTSVDLDVVNLREELPAFYDRLGFKPIATAPFPDPHKLKRDAHLVLMSKPL